MQPSSQPIQSALLRALKYFPGAGFIIKLIMDAATNDSMLAISSIIRDSCIILYLGCIIGVLVSPTVLDLPKFGIFIICWLLGLYVASIITNAQYIQTIDTSNADNIKPNSAFIWVLFEIIILFIFMDPYVSSVVSDRGYNRALFALSSIILPMIPHTWIVVTNFAKMKNDPTDG
jgi:hypothetical protein